MLLPSMRDKYLTRSSNYEWVPAETTGMFSLTANKSHKAENKPNRVQRFYQNPSQNRTSVDTGMFTVGQVNWLACLQLKIELNRDGLKLIWNQLNTQQVLFVKYVFCQQSWCCSNQDLKLATNVISTDRLSTWERIDCTFRPAVKTPCIIYSMHLNFWSAKILHTYRL